MLTEFSWRVRQAINAQGFPEVDPKTGESKQITKGPWIIRGITSIDEDQRQIWFAASGMYPGQDPYFINYGRVNFGGSGLETLLIFWQGL